MVFFQCTLVGYLPLPFVAKKLSFAMVSLLYALYAFEYKWMNQGEFCYCYLSIFR